MNSKRRLPECIRPGHPDRATQARLIRRYVAWRNRHADDPKLGRVVNTASVA